MNTITNIIKEVKADLKMSISNNNYEILETGFLKLILQTTNYIIGFNYTKMESCDKKCLYISMIQTVNKDPELILNFNNTHKEYLKINDEYSKDLEIILQLNLYKRKIEQYNYNIEDSQEKVRRYKNSINEYIKKKSNLISKLAELEDLIKLSKK